MSSSLSVFPSVVRLSIVRLPLFGFCLAVVRRLSFHSSHCLVTVPTVTAPVVSRNHSIVFRLHHCSLRIDRWLSDRFCCHSSFTRIVRSCPTPVHRAPFPLSSLPVRRSVGRLLAIFLIRSFVFPAVFVWLAVSFRVFVSIKPLVRLFVGCILLFW